MTQKHDDYLKKVASLDFSYQASDLIDARQKYLGDKEEGTLREKQNSERETYWDLQQFRHEYWGLSQEQRQEQLEKFSSNASPLFASSLKHLQELSVTPEEIKSLEEDEDLDPVFVEHLKRRLLWSDTAVPPDLDLRTSIATPGLKEYRDVKKSVPVLGAVYPEIAELVPGWLEMIVTSDPNLDQQSQSYGQLSPQTKTSLQPELTGNSEQDEFRNFLRTEIHENEANQPHVKEKTELEGWSLFFVILVVLFFIRLLIKFAGES